VRTLHYRLTWEEIVRLYGLTLDQPARNTQARYNVCPTDPVDTIVEHDGKRELVVPIKPAAVFSQRSTKKIVDARDKPA